MTRRNTANEALQQFRDNVAVKPFLAALNLERFARGEEWIPKQLTAAPAVEIEPLEQLQREQAELSSRVADLVDTYGFRMVEKWMRNDAGAPYEIMGTIRALVRRSIELDDQEAIRQPQVWFVSIWQRAPEVCPKCCWAPIEYGLANPGEVCSGCVDQPWPGPRRCAVCLAPCFGEVCSPGCATIAATEESIASGCFPEAEIPKVRAIAESMKGK